MKKDILLDVDGVIRDIITTSIKTYKELYNPYCNLEHGVITTYNFKNHMPLITNINKFFLQNKSQIFLNAEPYSEALEFVDFLKMAGHNIHIVTNQFRGAEDSTLKWLKKYNVPYDSLHFTKNKNTVNGDLLIDDCIDNLVIADKKVVCFDQPWNQEWKGNKAYNYNDIYKYLNNNKV